MTLQTLIAMIQRRLQSECFTDLVDRTGLAANTIWRWRENPPRLPSAKVLNILAHLCGLGHYLNQVDMST